MSFSSGNRHQRCKKHSFAPARSQPLPLLAVVNANQFANLKCHCDDLLITRHSDGYINRLACLYTTARLFINCPNETNGKFPVKFVKYFLILAVCCIRWEQARFMAYTATSSHNCRMGDIKRCSPANSDADLQRRWRLIAQYGEKRRIPVTLDQIPRRW